MSYLWFFFLSIYVGLDLEWQLTSVDEWTTLKVVDGKSVIQGACEQILKPKEQFSSMRTPDPHVPQPIQKKPKGKTYSNYIIQIVSTQKLNLFVS